MHRGRAQDRGSSALLKESANMRRDGIVRQYHAGTIVNQATI